MHFVPDPLPPLPTTVVSALVGYGNTSVLARYSSPLWLQELLTANIADFRSIILLNAGGELV